jgi:hypothetical protein
MKEKEMPEGIYELQYNKRRRLFHFADKQNKRQFGWVTLKPMSEDDCISFCSFMDKKYVDGRVTGVLPELSIVQLELALFFQLKKYRRKLAGRI